MQFLLSPPEETKVTVFMIESKYRDSSYWVGEKSYAEFKEIVDKLGDHLNFSKLVTDLINAGFEEIHPISIEI